MEGIWVFELGLLERRREKGKKKKSESRTLEGRTNRCSSRWSKGGTIVCWVEDLLVGWKGNIVVSGNPPRVIRKYSLMKHYISRIEDGFGGEIIKLISFTPKG